MNDDYILQDPTRPGTYRWRKNYQWEPVTRDVRVATAGEFEGQLVTFSNRLGREVPLRWLQAGGSEWHAEDLRKNGCLTASEVAVRWPVDPLREKGCP